MFQSSRTAWFFFVITIEVTALVFRPFMTTVTQTVPQHSRILSLALMRYIQGIALQKSFIILSTKMENWSVFNELQKQLDECSDVTLCRQPFFLILFWSKQDEKLSFQNDRHGSRMFDAFGFFCSFFLVVNLDIYPLKMAL